MKIRRVTLEVEIPWSIKASELLSWLTAQLNEFAVNHQEQVVADELSTNKRIGE